MQQGRDQRRNQDLHGRQGWRQDWSQVVQQRVHRAPRSRILLHVQGPWQCERLRWVWRLVQGVSYINARSVGLDGCDTQTKDFSWESGPTGSPTSTGGWPLYGKYTMEFTLPTTLEDGEYLLRGEHIGIHENREFFPYVCSRSPD